HRDRRSEIFKQLVMGADTKSEGVAFFVVTFGATSLIVLDVPTNVAGYPGGRTTGASSTSRIRRAARTCVCEAPCALAGTGLLAMAIGGGGDNVKEGRSHDGLPPAPPPVVPPYEGLAEVKPDGGTAGSAPGVDN
ncbi:hypothetical protein Vretimale_8431, partial [Volvox reticuliferus]